MEKIQLFLILVFSTLAFICYNLYVAKTTEQLAQLNKVVKELVSQQVSDINHKLHDLLERNGGDLGKNNLIDGITEINSEDVPEYIEVRTNQKSLSDLIIDTATEEDYESFVNGIIDVVQDLYANYQFLRQDPAKDDYESGYFLAFQFMRAEYPVMYEKLFRLAIDKGLDHLKVNKLFVDKVAEGTVLELGDAVIDVLGTGLSPILQGQDVRINVTFAPKEYAEKKEKHLQEVMAEREAKRKEQQEVAKQKDSVLQSIRVAQALLDNLTEEVAEKENMTELLNQIKESMGYL